MQTGIVKLILEVYIFNLFSNEDNCLVNLQSIPKFQRTNQSDLLITEDGPWVRRGSFCYLSWKLSKIFPPSQISGCSKSLEWEELADISHSLKISSKNIRRWVIHGAKRKQGCGRKCLDSQMEAQLYDWCKQRLKWVDRLSRTAIKQKALELTKFKNLFKASKGWLDKFVRKYNLIQNKRRINVKLEIKSEEE